MSLSTTPPSALDPNGAPWDQSTLHALGASMVAIDATGALTVTPAIDFSGYAAKLATLKVAVLVAYAQAKQTALSEGGITVNVGTAAAPNVIDVASDTKGDGLVSGNIQYIGLCSQAGQPAPTFNWINNPINGAPGVQTNISSAQMLSVGLTLRAFMQATYDALGVVNTAIANGTITSEAGVDTASWPATSY